MNQSPKLVYEFEGVPRTIVGNFFLVVYDVSVHPKKAVGRFLYPSSGQFDWKAELARHGFPRATEFRDSGRGPQPVKKRSKR